MVHSIPTQGIQTIFTNRKIYQLNNKNEFKGVIHNLKAKNYSLQINGEKGACHDYRTKIRDS